MAKTLDGRLVVAISSRALFDFEEENQLFEGSDDRAYMNLQLQRLEVPAKPGVAYSLVNKLLAFNTPEHARVEVVILSRNDPASGLRVFRSVAHHGLEIERGVFTRGRSPWRYLKPLQAHLFLSANEADVRQALDAGIPAARVLPRGANARDDHPDEIRIAFDGDAVLFSDQAEQVYKNIADVLKGCGLGLNNIVKTTTYLLNPDDMAVWRDAQKQALGDIKPASTLLFISRLARPEYLIEVDVIAAKD